MPTASEKEIGLIIVSVFKKTREAPEDPFDEEKFLNSLMADNRPLADVRNSFKALRKLNRFYDLLQLECGVCLDLDDPQKNWSVAKLAGHIARKKENPAAQKTLVRKRHDRAKANVVYEPVKFALFVIIPVTVVLYGLFHKTLLGLAFPALGLLAIYGVYAVVRNEARFYRKLETIIERDSETSAQHH